MMYHMPPHIVAGLAGADLTALNIPDEKSYVEAYCRRTGRTGIPHYQFYMAFNFFRMAAIFHGIKGRVLRGNASSARSEEHTSELQSLMRISYSVFCLK